MSSNIPFEGVRASGQRHAEGEDRALGVVGGDFQLAAVGQGDLAGNVQSKTKARLRGIGGRA